ncbi:hypothetical protein T265_11624 [Opisthorchis viverrini]|uniref:Uncharacterized protein n=1 Tax=Opisthorchis viverrini TaxID=6198 RepID=A0A074Z8X1_OPIVI|nr:hypothetical protein T265_11624 [Opisthorchis viverrini]KER19660.1 hypothetical protein T265_11624 [Opisthorchis viverrini]
MIAIVTEKCLIPLYGVQRKQATGTVSHVDQIHVRVARMIDQRQQREKPTSNGEWDNVVYGDSM